MVSGAPWANKDVSFYVFAPHRVSSQSHLLSLMELIVHLGCQVDLELICALLALIVYRLAPTQIRV